MLPPPDFKPITPEELFVNGKPGIYADFNEINPCGTYFFYDGKSSLVSDEEKNIEVGSSLSMKLYLLNDEEADQEISELKSRLSWLEKKLGLINQKRKAKR